MNKRILLTVVCALTGALGNSGLRAADTPALGAATWAAYKTANTAKLAPLLAGNLELGSITTYESFDKQIDALADAAKNASRYKNDTAYVTAMQRWLTNALPAVRRILSSSITATQEDDAIAALKGAPAIPARPGVPAKAAVTGIFENMKTAGINGSITQAMVDDATKKWVDVQRAKIDPIRTKFGTKKKEDFEAGMTLLENLMKDTSSLSAYGNNLKNIVADALGTGTGNMADAVDKAAAADKAAMKTRALKFFTDYVDGNGKVLAEQASRVVPAKTTITNAK